MLNLFTPITGLALVLNFIEEGAFERGTTLTFLKNLTLLLGGSFLVLVTLFFALMEKKYQKNFFSTESGGQLTRRLFLDGDDFMKSFVFGRNKKHWMPLKGKIATWITEGWTTWEEEKPEWFTDTWKASVPEDMKPAKKNEDDDNGNKISAENEVEEDLKVGGGEKQKGRRRSVLEVLSGQKAVSSKVMPAEGIKKEIDVEEFEREMKRRGSMTL